MIALIPGLCPFDDIILWLLAPAILIWIKKRKWCRKSCGCGCHKPSNKPSRSPWFRDVCHARKPKSLR